MSDVIEALVDREYEFGFHSDLDTDLAPKGLDEDIVRLISAKKDEPEWLLEWRLGAFRHFMTLDEPTWPNVHHPPIDYQDMHYWAAPKPKPQLASLDEVDPEIRATFDKLGISIADAPGRHAPDRDRHVDDRTGLWHGRRVARRRAPRGAGRPRCRRRRSHAGLVAAVERGAHVGSGASPTRAALSGMGESADPSGTAGWTSNALLAVLLVSVPVGVTLAWTRR